MARRAAGRLERPNVGGPLALAGAIALGSGLGRFRSMLFTCAAPHVFVQEKAEDKAALLKAKVVKADDAGFADLDAKYLASCKNPLVKSAIPKKK